MSEQTAVRAQLRRAAGRRGPDGRPNRDPAALTRAAAFVIYV